MGALLSSDPSNTEENSTMHSQNTTHPGAINLLASMMSSGCFTDLGSHKMIFVVNMDLNMGRGKQCAQVAHAALGLYIKIQESNHNNDKTKLYQWLSMGQKKIVVKCKNLEEMVQVQNSANQAKLPNMMISDAGCTQIPPGSKTVLSIFGSNEELDKVTGHLKLL